MSEQSGTEQGTGAEQGDTTVNATNANVTVEAPTAESEGGTQDGGGGGLEAEDSKVEQASADSAKDGE